MSDHNTSQRLIGALLRIPFQAAVSRIHAGLVAAGYVDLSPAQLSVFQHMRPGGVRLTELADLAQITKQSMGYLVTYLEERGYLERLSDPTDGRAKIVRLTERGRDVEVIARQVLADLDAEWSQHLGQSRMDELHGLLVDLVAYLEARE